MCDDECLWRPHGIFGEASLPSMLASTRRWSDEALAETLVEPCQGPSRVDTVAIHSSRACDEVDQLSVIDLAELLNAKGERGRLSQGRTIEIVSMGYRRLMVCSDRASIISDDPADMH